MRGKHMWSSGETRGVFYVWSWVRFLDLPFLASAWKFFFNFLVSFGNYLRGRRRRRKAEPFPERRSRPRVAVKPRDSNGEAGREEGRDPPFTEKYELLLISCVWGSFESIVVRREILRKERLLLLIIANFYFRYTHAKVGQKRDPDSNVAAVVTNPVKSDDAGRKW